MPKFKPSSLIMRITGVGCFVHFQAMKPLACLHLPDDSCVEHTFLVYSCCLRLATPRNLPAQQPAGLARLPAHPCLPLGCQWAAPVNKSSAELFSSGDIGKTSAKQLLGICRCKCFLSYPLEQYRCLSFKTKLLEGRTEPFKTLNLL